MEKDFKPHWTCKRCEHRHFAFSSSLRIKFKKKKMKFSVINTRFGRSLKRRKKYWMYIIRPNKLKNNFKGMFKIRGKSSKKPLHTIIAWNPCLKSFEILLIIIINISSDVVDVWASIAECKTVEVYKRCGKSLSWPSIAISINGHCQACRVQDLHSLRSLNRRNLISVL